MPQEGARAEFLPVQGPGIPGKAQPRLKSHRLGRSEGGKGIAVPCNFCHGMRYFGYMTQPPS